MYQSESFLTRADRDARWAQLASFDEVLTVVATKRGQKRHIKRVRHTAGVVRYTTQVLGHMEFVVSWPVN